jgi:hypothetical protein
MADAINVTYGSLSFAAFGLAAIIASTDWRFRLAINGTFTRDAAVQQRMDKLHMLRNATHIADEAGRARRFTGSITTEGFGRKNGI